MDKNEQRVFTIGKANTRHAGPARYGDDGKLMRDSYPICGQAQGRHGQGVRPVNHVSFNLDKVTCSKCAAALKVGA